MTSRNIRLIALLLTLPLVASANEPPGKGVKKSGFIHEPCKPIVSACEKAGFYEGGAKEKKGSPAHPSSQRRQRIAVVTQVKLPSATSSAAGVAPSAIAGR